jgi:hypothetical protein
MSTFVPECQFGSSADFAVITKSDTDDLPQITKYIYVGGTGNITCINQDGAAVLISAIPAGTTLPVRTTRVNSTATTATLMVAFF